MAIDTHCHLTLRFEQYELASVLSSALAENVGGVILVGYCPVHYSLTAAILDIFGTGGGDIPALAGTIGIHPHEADKFSPAHIEDFEKELNREDIIAIGETGLDYFRDYASRDNQKKLFESQVALSSKTGYPLVIHSRAAFDDTISILSKYQLPDPPGVFHCYGYGPNEVNTVVSMGFYISFAGNLTYNNAADTRRAAAICPMDKILIETDSPFLVPQKAKNRKIKRCEPALVIETLNELSIIKGCGSEQMDQQLITNTLACFTGLNKLASWAALKPAAPEAGA